MKVTDKYVLFWGSVFSNFAKTEYLSHDGILFRCSEQEFMYRKAIHFGDQTIAEKILLADKPAKIKALGREVRNFDGAEWDRVRAEYMYRACLSKFTGCARARRAILSYPDHHFVEASPYDTIWGIGLKEDDPRANDPSQWRGRNLLGQTLDRVRQTILDEMAGQ